MQGTLTRGWGALFKLHLLFIHHYFLIWQAESPAPAPRSPDDQQLEKSESLEEGGKVKTSPNTILLPPFSPSSKDGLTWLLADFSKQEPFPVTVIPGETNLQLTASFWQDDTKRNVVYSGNKICRIWFRGKSERWVRFHSFVLKDNLFGPRFKGKF